MTCQLSSPSVLGWCESVTNHVCSPQSELHWWPVSTNPKYFLSTWQIPVSWASAGPNDTQYAQKSILSLPSQVTSSSSLFFSFSFLNCTPRTTSPGTSLGTAGVECSTWWRSIASPINDMSVERSWNGASLWGAGIRGSLGFEGCHGFAKC